jgi:hypothetical protein
MSCLTQVLFFVHMRGPPTMPRMFTPVFTPARFFSRPIGAQNFQQTIVPQARLQFATDFCPLYPQKRICAVQLAMSAMGQ